jgi:O-antigen/teichoic acid export membrane protein
MRVKIFMVINKFKNYIITIFIRFIVYGYESIFHEKISVSVVDFFKDLYYVAIGTIISTSISFIFNIFGARILGPSEYGYFTLIQSTAMFLYIPMSLGLDTAMVKYNSEKENFNRQRCIISTTYILVFIFVVISLFIYYLFSTQISNLFSISKEMFYLAVLFAFLFVFNLFTTSSLRSLRKMKMFSALQPLFSIILLVSFSVFIFINITSFKSMLFSMYIAYGITGVIILIFTSKYLRPKFTPSMAKNLWRYSNITALSGTSFMLYTNIDKILINKYMHVADVGIYNAYFYSSINVIGLFYGIFVTVFFPTISKYKDQTVILKRVNKLIPLLIIFGFLLTLSSQLVILKFYGNSFPISIPLILIFAITSVLVAWYGIYAWIFNSQGEKGAKLTLSGTATIAVANIALNLYLIPHFGLYGAITATAFAYCIGMGVVYIRRKNVLI